MKIYELTHKPFRNFKPLSVLTNTRFTEVTGCSGTPQSHIYIVYIYIICEPTLINFEQKDPDL